MWKNPKFLPNPLFFYNIEVNKLNIYCLNEDPIPIYLYLKSDNGNNFVCCDEDSFDCQRKYPDFAIPVLGTLHIYNTLERIENNFQNCMKKIKNQILDEMSKTEGELNFLQLFRCLLLCYSDPKTHIINYIFHFPIINLTLERDSLKISVRKYKDVLLEDNQIVMERITDYLYPSTNHHPVLELNQAKENKNEAGNEQRICYKDVNQTSNIFSSYLMNIISYFIYVKVQSSLDILSCRFVDFKWCIDDYISISSTKIIDPSDLKWLEESVNFKEETWYKSINLSSLLDRKKLIQDTFLLNLKLMKWQLYPKLDIDKLTSLKCLLFGAGTLGCNVARNLLGWGVTNITFVDNSTVSYSNPSRQSLYTTSDCIGGKTKKVDAAVEALKQVYEYGNYEGYNLTIPSPGHPIHPKEVDAAVSTIKLIEKLILENDVIFLLTDSRESRWLPTLLSSYHNKFAICVAIGGDSFLVIRHGSNENNSSSPIENEDYFPSSSLGCYFCNDFVHPNNSLTGRSYDKRCSVSRPGISMMASSHAVELIISLLNSPEGLPSPSLQNFKDIKYDASMPMGVVPHQIRYFLSEYSLLLGVGRKFRNCSACSSYVINEYKLKGYNFIIDVCAQPKILNSITKMDSILEDIDKQLDDFDLDNQP